jgi:hypothetical protein
MPTKMTPAWIVALTVFNAGGTWAQTPPRNGAGPDPAYLACLQQKVKTGNYSSFDHGHSAGMLMEQCPQWKAWVSFCITKGYTSENCTYKAGVLAQAVLKFSGK